MRSKRPRTQSARMLAKTFVIASCFLFLSSTHASASQNKAQSNDSDAPSAEEAEASEDQVNSDERGLSLSGNFLSIGPGISGNLFPPESDPGSMAYSFTGGHAWDVRGAMLTLGGDLQIQGDALMVDAGLGARFSLPKMILRPTWVDSSAWASQRAAVKDYSQAHSPVDSLPAETWAYNSFEPLIFT